MPRTKAPKKKNSTLPNDNDVNNNSEFNKLLKQLATKKKESIEEIEVKCKDMLSNQENMFMEQMAQIPITMLHKTILEINNNTSSTTMFASCINNSVNPVLNSTKTTTAKKRNVLTRTKSSLDEGYLTAESNRGTSGTTRQSRREQRKNSTRVSRSLSRTNMKKQSMMKRNLKTPTNQSIVTSETYGTVTPKVKPNVPQVLLRRPKQGEMALSLQGSPLFTGSVVSETIANVNIPLADGRLFSIQPERGLRLSQIPQLDITVKRQLETLRDHLNRVCAVNPDH